MKNEKLRKIYNELIADRYVTQMVAQSDARYILYETGEGEKNFPKFNIKNEKLDLLAFHYLDIGCRMAEDGEDGIAREALEKCATILSTVHSPTARQARYRKYYELIAAMAYYSCYHYSKAFILAKKIEHDTLISKMIVLFLKRSFPELLKTINEMIVKNEYFDQSISRLEDDSAAQTKIYEITIGKALYRVVNYLQNGDTQLLVQTRKDLLNLQRITEFNGEPAVRWVVKLLSLIVEGIGAASLWFSLGKYFDISKGNINKYIRSLVYSHKPITELFITQRDSLVKVLNPDNTGAVISMPTSSGKTRIAEIAIVDCLEKNTSAKVLYIAPFRSLSHEVENSLNLSLGSSGISISGLYGSGFVSGIDISTIFESDVIIATPEKIKAILRSNRNIIDSIKLVIIDEGHLLGASERLIRYEIFIEELRYLMGKSGGKFLVLSAVLPNAVNISSWLANSEDSLFSSKWKPSGERFGILEYSKNNVRINWINSDKDLKSFNPHFVKDCKTKNEAVASVAYKLRGFGPALIFVGRKDSVFTIAAEYRKCLGEYPERHEWKDEKIWIRFELAVKEYYGEKNKWLEYAEFGILCHNSALHADVRIPLEQLMSKDRPLVIIATSTLGQGVNLGVSTVVFQTMYQTREALLKSDFWNIAGRAGRAFVDHEAKILVTLDKKVTKANNSSKIKVHEKQIFDYFDKTKIEKAESGILFLIQFIIRLADRANIDFNLMLQLLTENKLEKFGATGPKIEEILDLLDDSLLALHELNSGEEDIKLYDWIDTFFSHSLGYLQIREDEYITSEKYLAFIKARIGGIVAKIGSDKTSWKNHIATGIPLRSSLFLDNKIEEIVGLIQKNLMDDQSIESKIKTVTEILECINKIPEFRKEDSELLEGKDFNDIVNSWMRGDSITTFDKYSDIVNKLFTFKLPWLFNGIAKKLDSMGLEIESKIVAEIAMLIDTGLPDLKTVILYQSGIKSRKCSCELSKVFDDSDLEKTIKSYKHAIIEEKSTYLEIVSEDCGKWIELLSEDKNPREIKTKTITNLHLGNLNEKCNRLIAICVNADQYLISPDLSVVENATKHGIDFSSVCGIPGIYFNYDLEDKVWKIQIENPFVVMDEG